MSELVHLLIADRHPCILEGIKNVLEDQTFDTLGQVTTFAQLDDYCRERQPHILVISLNFLPAPFMNALHSFQKRYAGTKVLIYTEICDIDCFHALLDMGISGCVLKEEPVNEVRMAIQAIKNGGTYFSRTIVTELLQPKNEPLLNPLTEREQEVLQFIGQGMSNRQIAECLSITCRTVKFHTANIYDKLGGLSRAETIAWAWQNGIVSTNAVQQHLPVPENR